jgi:MFS family permease
MENPAHAQVPTAIVDEEYLPGTERLFASEGHPLPDSTNLKKHGNIVLNPQPTDSPNDPLHWSLPRKYWHSFLVCFVTGLTAATSNDAGSSQYGQNTDLGISYDAMNTAAGVLFVGIGYWTLLISPAAFLYGRRITYLICITLGLIGAVWLANIHNTNDSIWNQLFVGASEACAEANVQLSLSDMFFQHQRGTVIGVYVLATSVGTYMGPLIGGFIADSTQGWRWIGWWSVIISGGLLVVLFFGLEETGFDRHANEDVSIEGTRLKGGSFDAADNKVKGEKDTAAVARTGSDEIEGTTPAGPQYKLNPYWKRMALITPAKNIRGLGFKQYFRRLWHTLRVFTFPAVMFAGLQWGAQDAWLTFYLTLEEENWYGPPWNYTDAQDGIMNVPCLIGAVIGCFYGGYLSDRFVIWMAKRNGGVREAEHRLWFMYLCAIISPVGLLIFGIGTAQGWSWGRPYLGLGFIGFGWGCAGDLSMTYLMDAYPDMVLEGMVGVAVINNTIGCIFTFTCSDWLAASGTQNTFIAIAVLDFVFMMMTVPMMIWGKTFRRWTLQRYLKFLEVRDGMDQ